MSTSSPFFYQTAWYVHQNRKRIYLIAGTPEEKAKWKRGKRSKDFTPPSDVEREWHRLMVIENPHEMMDEIYIDELAEMYLEDTLDSLCQKNKTAYRNLCYDFVGWWGHKKIESITPSQMRRWAKSHPTWKSPSQIRSAIKKILQMLNWGVSEKYISQNPIHKMKLPLDVARDVVISEEDEEIILAEAHDSFAEFFIALMQTGRRPNEVAKWTPRNVVKLGDGKLGVKFKGKNFKKKGKEETIPLNSVMQEMISTKLETTSPDELLFTSENGVQYRETNWNRPLITILSTTAVDDQIRMYACRHTYITRALKRGTPIGLVARLVGNSIETLLKHYAHLDKEVADDLFDACELATT